VREVVDQKVIGSHAGEIGFVVVNDGELWPWKGYMDARDVAWPFEEPPIECHLAQRRCVVERLDGIPPVRYIVPSFGPFARDKKAREMGK
jgi:hypothetical protein